MTGVVVVGLREARSLGYPTINIAYEGALEVPSGVYAATVRTIDGVFLGAAVVGGDFVESLHPKLEIHLLDDVAPSRYGETVEIELNEKVGTVERIGDLDLLRKKIEEDIARVRATKK